MKQKWKIYIFISIIFLAMFQGKAIYATSASVAFSSTSKSYVVGDSFIVTVSVESGANMSDFQTYVAYDPAVLQLVDTGNYVTGSDGLVFISDLENEASKSKQYRMKFKAIKEAETEIYISDKVYIFEAGTGEEMSVSKNTLRLNIQKSKVDTLAKHEGLQSLMVSEGTLEPAFSSDVTNYRVEVSSATNTLFIDAKKKLKAYQVEIEGNTDLQSGENKAYVRVKDSEQNEKIYVITIYKRSTEEELLLLEQQKEEESDLATGVILKQEHATIYFSTSISLELVPLPDRSLIPNGYIEDSIKINGILVPVYRLEEEGVSDFVLLYGKTKDGSAKFYVYDRIGEHVQRYVEENKKTIKEQEIDTYKQREELLFAVLFVMVVMLLGTLSVLIRTKARHHKRYELLEQEYEEEL